MVTFEKRVLIDKIDGAYWYTLQVRKWYSIPFFKSKWRTVNPMYQTSYEDAYNLTK